MRRSVNLDISKLGFLLYMAFLLSIVHANQHRNHDLVDDSTGSKMGVLGSSNTAPATKMFPIVSTKNSTLPARGYTIPRNLIIFGQPVNKGDYPSFGWSVGRKSGLLCGGTLIHPDIFLTSAKCSDDIFQKHVFIGGIKRDGSDGEMIQTDFQVRHPGFRDKFAFPDDSNDIMIVKLSSPSSAPLQKLNFDNDIPANVSILTTIGYGVTENNTFSEVLLKLETNHNDPDYCQYWFDLFLCLKYDSDIMICAGGDSDNGTCTGDTGGPLLTDDGFQVGLVSFRAPNSCGYYDEDVYTRISAYEDFIKNMICGYSDVKLDSIDCVGRPVLRPPCQCRRTNLLCRLIRGCLQSYP